MQDFALELQLVRTKQVGVLAKLGPNLSTRYANCPVCDNLEGPWATKINEEMFSFTPADVKWQQKHQERSKQEVYTF